MANVAVDALFLGSGIERRFAILTSPREGQALGAAMFVHAFAEEQNKSRRMVSLTARALAEQGYAVLQTDLHGCGDSAGDFADATWDGWIADIAAAHAWLRQETRLPVALLAMRLGAILATAALPRLEGAPRIVFWQPVLSGAQFLRQFLRLKIANTLLAGSTGAGGARALIQSLGKGQAIDVAGYVLSPALALPMEAATLDLVAPCPSVAWLEVSSSTPATMGPASVDRIKAWKEAGIQIEAASVSGSQFWQTQEIEECPALVDATKRAFDGAQV